jgi:5-methylthioadenosine/S-adenosylhomocysteine deaminase
LPRRAVETGASLLVRGGDVLTLEGEPIRDGSVAIERGRITAVGKRVAAPRGARVLDATDAIVVPGFVQTHVHLCQTLFRGLADDLPLLDWLRRRIFPLEAAHDERSLRASARLGCAELLRSGTTAVLTMESVHDTDVVFEALAESGLHAAAGRCLIDRGDGLPRRLRDGARRAMAESLDLARRWHGAAGGRLRYALAPRFVPGCTEGLLREVAAEARSRSLLVHTHASENRDEVALVRRLTGRDNVRYLDDVGLSGTHVVVAHAIHLSAAEVSLLARRGTRVAHCPSSNLKLGSGVAPVARLRRAGVCVSLGADGAACNNRLDPFIEMRLASGLAAIAGKPGDVGARAALEMATIEGARALGLEREMGSLAVGKLGNLAVVGRRSLQATPVDDPVSAIVHSATAADVRHVVVEGRVLVRDGRLTGYDEAEVRADAERERRRVLSRARLR